MELPLPRQKSGWGGSSGPSRTVPAGGRGGQAPLTHGCLPASGLSFPVCVVSGRRGPGGPGGSASLRLQRGASSPDRPSCVRLPPGPRRCRPDACPGPGPACPREPWAGPRPRPRACCRLWSLCSWELGVSWWLPIHSLTHSFSQSVVHPAKPSQRWRVRAAALWDRAVQWPWGWRSSRCWQPPPAPTAGGPWGALTGMCSFASHPSAGHRPGRWTTRPTPGECTVWPLAVGCSPTPPRAGWVWGLGAPQAGGAWGLLSALGTVSPSPDRKPFACSGDLLFKIHESGPFKAKPMMVCFLVLLLDENMRLFR